MLYHESLKETTKRYFMNSRAGAIYKILSSDCEKIAKKGLLSAELLIQTALDEKLIDSIVFFLKEEDDIEVKVKKVDRKDNFYIFNCSWKNSNKKRVVRD